MSQNDRRISIYSVQTVPFASGIYSTWYSWAISSQFEAILDQQKSLDQTSSAR